MSRLNRWTFPHQICIFKAMKKIPLPVIIVFFTGLAVIALSALWFATHNKVESKDPPGLIAVTEDSFAGPFTMVDQDNATFTQDDLKGRYVLMYFGFTYCPAICPTELQKITAALNLLPQEKADVITPVFVTVDPERDTPEKIKSYLSLFHPHLIGLMGSQEQVSAMLKNYKIYAAKVQDPQMSDYTMDHSSYIYLIGPDERLLHIFKMEDTAQSLADITGQWIPAP